MDAVATFVRRIGILACYVLIPAQIIVAISFIVGRQLFLVPATLLQELEWYLFTSTAFLTFGYAYLADRHVRIDVLRERFSPRVRARIEIAGFVLVLLPCFVLLVWGGAEQAWSSFAAGERSRSLSGMPWRWIVRAMIPIGAALLLLAGAVIVARNIAIVRRRTSLVVGDPPSRPSRTKP